MAYVWRFKIKIWTPPRNSGGIPKVSTRFNPSMEISRLMRDGTAEPVSRDQILRPERGQGNINFPCLAGHEQDWQPYQVCSLLLQCVLICDGHRLLQPSGPQNVSIIPKALQCTIRDRWILDLIPYWGCGPRKFQCRSSTST